MENNTYYTRKQLDFATDSLSKWLDANEQRRAAKERIKSSAEQSIVCWQCRTKGHAHCRGAGLRHTGCSCDCTVKMCYIRRCRKKTLSPPPNSKLGLPQNCCADHLGDAVLNAIRDSRGSTTPTATISALAIPAWIDVVAELLGMLGVVEVIRTFDSVQEEIKIDQRLRMDAKRDREVKKVTDSLLKKLQES